MESKIIKQNTKMVIRVSKDIKNAKKPDLYKKIIKEIENNMIIGFL